MYNGKRAVLVEGGAPLKIEEFALPRPEKGGVLLRVEMGGVCGTDVHLWHGDVPLPFPVVLGHEGVGVIEELGEGVTTDYAGAPVAHGDRVIWVPLKSCGRCWWCTIGGDSTLCEQLVMFVPTSQPTWGSYADYAWLPDGMAFYRVPEDTPSEAVIAFGCAMPTMLQAFERLGGIEPGQNVVVQGSGPVGLAATLLAHISGAGKVVVVGAPAQRLAMATEFGASATVNIDDVRSPEERAAHIRELTEGRGADVVIEAAGALAAFSEGIDLVATAGRYLIVGLWSGRDTVELDPRVINNRKLTIVGSAFAQPRHYYRALHLAREQHRRLPLASAVTHRYPVEESQSALEAVANLETIKAVIAPQ